MDTARLRALRTFPQVQTLLRSLLADRELIPPQSELIAEPDKLPRDLRHVLARAEERGHAWCAWVQAGELTALTADVSEDGSRMYARPVLQVFVHDHTGRVIGSSGWLETEVNRWSACELR